MSTLMSILFVGLSLASTTWADLQSDWDQILNRYVVVHPDGVNRFDYGALRNNRPDRTRLEKYIRSLEQIPVSTLEPNAQFAYWANLYNAVTVRLILDEAPYRSIRQIRPRPWSTGPWDVNRVVVEGRKLSLDDIEHEVMRQRFEASQVHYAVNCASIGCPNLMARAWRAETLEADLEAAARAYINHPRGVTVTEDGLVLSRIYAWFREDFGNSEAGVLAHLGRYAEPELAETLQSGIKIDRYVYDWTLNRSTP